MAGMRMEPTAAASAAADPEMPAKNMAETMATTAMPPGSQPTRELAKSIMRRLMPPASMITPVNMNKGTASKKKGIAAGVHPLHHHHQREVALRQDGGHGGHADGNGDGRPDGEQEQEAEQQDLSGQGSPPPSNGPLSSRHRKLRECRASMAPLKGMMPWGIHLGKYKAAETCRRMKWANCQP